MLSKSLLSFHFWAINIPYPSGIRTHQSRVKTIISLRLYLQATTAGFVKFVVLRTSCVINLFGQKKIPDQNIRKQDGIHFPGIQMIRLYAMAFEYQTFRHPTPFCLVFRSHCICFCLVDKANKTWCNKINKNCKIILKLEKV